MFSDYCYLDKIGMKWMIVEPLDFDESGNILYRFISWKKKETTAEFAKKLESYINKNCTLRKDEKWE